MKKNKLIILTFESGEKIAIKYTLKAIDFIYQNFDYIVDFEIIFIVDPTINQDIDLGSQNFITEVK